jgi:hypothetical protein
VTAVGCGATGAPLDVRGLISDYGMRLIEWNWDDLGRFDLEVRIVRGLGD